MWFRYVKGGNMAMSRRKLLAASVQVTSAAAAATALGATGAAAAEAGPGSGAGSQSRPAGLWAEFTANPFAHPQIPYVGRAGFRGGERHFPRHPVRANVLHYGALPDCSADAAPAINRALREVGEAGGGTVYLPPGTYRIDDVIQVGWDNTTLRGAGSGRTTLYATKSLTE